MFRDGNTLDDGKSLLTIHFCKLATEIPGFDVQHMPFFPEHNVQLCYEFVIGNRISGVVDSECMNVYWMDELLTALKELKDGKSPTMSYTAPFIRNFGRLFFQLSIKPSKEDAGYSLRLKFFNGMNGYSIMNMAITHDDLEGMIEALEGACDRFPSPRRRVKIIPVCNGKTSPLLTEKDFPINRYIPYQSSRYINTRLHRGIKPYRDWRRSR